MNHSLFSSTFSFYSLFLLKITAHFHLAIHRTALVVAFSRSVFSGKHRLGASLIFRELQMIVDAQTLSNVLHIKIIGADEGKGPVLLLQLLNEVLDHLQIILLAAILLTICDDSHQHAVILGGQGVDLGYAHAYGIIKRGTATWIVIP